MKVLPSYLSNSARSIAFLGIGTLIVSLPSSRGRALLRPGRAADLRKPQCAGAGWRSSLASRQRLIVQPLFACHEMYGGVPSMAVKLTVLWRVPLDSSGASGTRLSDAFVAVAVQPCHEYVPLG